MRNMHELLTDNPFVDACFTSSRLVKSVDYEDFERFPRREVHLVSSRVCDKENPLRILLLLDFLLYWFGESRSVGCVEIEHSGSARSEDADDEGRTEVVVVVVDDDVGCLMLDEGADD